MGATNTGGVKKSPLSTKKKRAITRKLYKIDA